MVTFNDSISIIDADNSIRNVPLNPDGASHDSVPDLLELSNHSGSMNLEGVDGEYFQDSVSEMTDAASFWLVHSFRGYASGSEVMSLWQVFC
jgi:hypothetical protein